MTSAPLMKKVAEIVANLARHSDPAGMAVDADLYQELGVKSASALDLLLSLEDEFGVSIPDERFGDARTVVQLSRLVSELS